MVSIIVPTFNSEKFLYETIRSVLDQTYQDFEIIITDNNSADNTVSIAQEFSNDSRISLYRNNKNLGMAENWNSGILKAKGEYIKVLCSDDLLEPDALEKSVDILDNNENVVLVSSFRRYFGQREGLLESPFTDYITGTDAIKKVIWNYNWIGEPSSTMFRSSSLYIGLFNPEWRQNVDVDFWLRLLKTGDLYIIPQPLVMFRQHSMQATKKVFEKEGLLLERYDFFMSKYSKYEYYGFELDHLLNKKRIRILNGVLGHVFALGIKRKISLAHTFRLVRREKLYLRSIRNFIKALFFSIVRKSNRRD